MQAAQRLVDCHAHLGDAVFDADRAEVLERARRAGVAAVVSVGETLADAERNLQLAGEHPAILPAAGLYPTWLDLEQAERLERLIRQRRTSRAIPRMSALRAPRPCSGATRRTAARALGCACRGPALIL